LNIFEPNSNKSLNYDIINTQNLSDIIKINQNIEVLNKEFENVNLNSEVIENSATDLLNKNKRILLLIGKENIVRFTITIENISPYILENIRIKKYISTLFYNIQYESNFQKNYLIKPDNIESTISELKQGQKIEISITAKVALKKKEFIKTGNIEISFGLKNDVITGLNIKDFSAYSHAMHAINKIEEEDEPNNWTCSLKFENHSDFPIKLKSVLVVDKSKSISYLEESNLTNQILPGDGYISKTWKFKDENEPKFLRKVEYSVDYKYERKSIITMLVDEHHFETVNIDIKKEISSDEIKSFEASEFNNKILIKNVGSIPVDIISIVEVIPKDFLPPLDKTKYSLKNSKSELKSADYIVEVSPSDEDPAKEHKLEIKIPLNNKQHNYALDIDDFIELNYEIKALNPNNKVNYEFPLEIATYFAKYDDSAQNGQNIFYMINKKLEKEEQPKLKVAHRRRKLTVEKEIFPGKSVDEFAINILVKNLSNVEIKNINISDNFPDAFKFISSTSEHKLSKSDGDGLYTISFLIESMPPYQEKEIMYYLKNESGKNIQYSDLESFLYS
jgi:hypothetical protein